MAIDVATLVALLKAETEATNPSLLQEPVDGSTVSDLLEPLWTGVSEALKTHLDPQLGGGDASAMVRVSSGTSSPTSGPLSVFDTGTYGISFISDDLVDMVYNAAAGTVTVQTAGRYRIDAVVQARCSVASDTVMAYLDVGGATRAMVEAIPPQAGQTFQLVTSWIEDLAVSDTIEVFAEPNAGDLTLRAGSLLAIQRIG